MAVTPNYSWPVPVNTDYVKDGADAIKDLGDAIDATVYGLPSGALALVKSQTIGTAVTSVEVTGAFSATYDNYVITVAGGSASNQNLLRLQLGATTSNYQFSLTYTSYSSGAFNSDVGSAGTAFPFIGSHGPNGNGMVANILSPNLAKVTRIFANGVTDLSGVAGNTVGLLNNTTSYTAFTLIPGAGTLTGGTIRVYGYQN
jgi:hypothetical protein